MKRLLSLFLVVCLLLSACAPQVETPAQTPESTVQAPEQATPQVQPEPETVPTFTNLSDPALVTYLEDDLYDGLITALHGEDYFVEQVEVQYISQEYIEEMAYNSQENLYFGYTLSDLAEEFDGTQYVFTTDGTGKTIAKPFEAYDYAYEKALTDVAVGSGVILVCVTVSVATGGVAPAVSAVLAVSAETGTVMATSSGAISGIMAGVVTGVQTQDMEQACKAAAIAGGEGFKWGAISGAITGGVTQFNVLHGATLNGLTMNEAAMIQKESKYPLELIRYFDKIEQYDECRKIGLTTKMINGKTSLVQKIDLNAVDDLGKTNLQRMDKGLAPLDKTGTPYELHHLGQKVDSPLAILTQKQHDLKIWHDLTKASEVHVVGNNWDKQRADYWKSFATMAMDAVA